MIRSPLRLQARAIIDAIMADMPEDATVEQIGKALRGKSPWPCKDSRYQQIWLVERGRVIGEVLFRERERERERKEQIRPDHRGNMKMALRSVPIRDSVGLARSVMGRPGATWSGRRGRAGQTRLARFDQDRMASLARTGLAGSDRARSGRDGTGEVGNAGTAGSDRAGRGVTGCGRRGPERPGMGGR